MWRNRSLPNTSYRLPQHQEYNDEDPQEFYYRRTSSNVSALSQMSVAESVDIDCNENDQKQSNGRVKKLRKPLHGWSKDDVTKWLRKYLSEHYQQYQEIFDYHELTGRALLRLDSTKLERIGITDPNHREEILQKIFCLQIKHQTKLLQKLQTTEGDPESSPE